MSEAEQKEMVDLDLKGFEVYKKKQAARMISSSATGDTVRRLVVIIATMLLAAQRTALVLFEEAMAAATPLEKYGINLNIIVYFALSMAVLTLITFEG